MEIADIAPDGWQLVSREDERVVFRSAQVNAQATISVLLTGKPASFADFEKICQHRLSVERTQDVTFSTLRGPTDEKKRFVFEFIGVANPAIRLFSGLMICVATRIQTLYVESIGVDPTQHMMSFHSWRSALRL
jgi:hypothetical protein